MKIPSLFVLTIPFSLFLASPAAESPTDLTFEDRVRAQEAIERVYHSHRIDADEFETDVPTEVLQEKVRRFLRQSNALEWQWKTVITEYMLDRELQRMLRDTNDSQRLQELFVALEDDPVLIRECLARPILVDRLVRNFFATDELLHAETRRAAERLREALATGHSRVLDDRAGRRIEERSSVARQDALSPAVTRGREPTTVDAAEFAVWRKLAPPEIGEIGPVDEYRETFEFRVVLEENSDWTRIAVYEFPKNRLEPWLGVFEARPVRTVAAPDAASSSPANFEPCEESTWSYGIQSPAPRADHATVWTGSEMIVCPQQGKGGSRYDPATDTWTAISMAGAPQMGFSNTAVWTGNEMIVWGGFEYLGNFNYNNLDVGGRYDPATDTWALVSTLNAPIGRANHTAVWTGDEMIVWGGRFENYGSTDTGGRYDPETDSWTPTNPVAPAAREHHTAIWTGDRMIVWGGRNFSGGWIFAEGAMYDPAADTWATLSTTNAPELRARHAAVWTGDEMIIWGGVDELAGVATAGGIYDPDTNTWSPISTEGAPSAGISPTATWTGSEMVVFGGKIDTYEFVSGGGRYDPVSDAWSSIAALGAPSDRSRHAAVWTGSLLMIWGGYDVRGPFNNNYLGSGARYDPTTDSWTPISSGTWQRELVGSRIVWTGNELISWGGAPYSSTSYPRKSGTVFNPTTGSNTPTNYEDAPGERDHHSAVWTGAEMVIWGGNPISTNTTLDDGARYDPVADSWSAVSMQGPPESRASHSAVWTGDRMIVWGGKHRDDEGEAYLTSGGSYDPVTDSWEPISNLNAPGGRIYHSTVWTGDEMIIWGGRELQTDGVNTGGRYDPLADTWTRTSTTGAPDARYWQSAVWTGSELVVWGGLTTVPVYDPYTGELLGYENSSFDTGGRYDRQLDSWSSATLSNSPAPRYGHSAIWTGEEMVIWGGRGDGGYFADGGRYLLGLDAWAPVTTQDAPSARVGHDAIWTGTTMVVWGGKGEANYGSFPTYVDTPVFVVGDMDGDGVCYPDDCNPTNPYCSLDCADADFDGYCVTIDCDESNANCGIDCTDLDEDGFCVTHDCDDSLANCTTDCTDDDSDGFCVTTDCDDTIANCNVDCVGDADADYTPECRDNCPGVFNPFQTDADSDGWGEATGCDCDGGNPNTHPGAPEINDGLDNQCPDENGYGVVDEISGVCGFFNPADRDEFSWTAQAGATSYEVARSSGVEFADDCLTVVTAGTSWIEVAPVPTGSCHHYLARALSPNPGSWGANSAGVERTNVCP